MSISTMTKEEVLQHYTELENRIILATDEHEHESARREMHNVRTIRNDITIREFTEVLHK